MTACPDFARLLVLPHLKVQNANAISSQLTHGFPSITAFAGLMWALERKLAARDTPPGFVACGVIAHAAHEATVRSGFIDTFRLTRNPPALRGHRKLIKPDAPTGIPAIVEEGRMHMDVTLLLAATRREPDPHAVLDALLPMRVAGGSILPRTNKDRVRHQPFAIDFTGTTEDQETEFQKHRHHLLPGFALVERSDLLAERLQTLREHDSNATALDAWLSRSRWNWRWKEDAEGKGRWQSDRPTGSGWIMPIPIGYGALDDRLHEPGTVKGARDATTPFRFVESLYTLGEWRSPHRIEHPRQLLWHLDNDLDAGVYRLRNDPGAISALTSGTTYEPDYD